ncbi:MAG TPA: hypothetical protein VFZ22_06795 [Pyrinomonadaceae bacterium]|nr:hypothetical protein [Pyrinomonadaceae bacterium]
MPIELWIDDGNPWYLSPDIWVVPGNDPSGAPGIPIAGVAGYVWARVHNRGTTQVTNATVRFYWANPSMVITPNTATAIGTSFVSLLPGETKEVLCLTQWTPVWVNDGHECLIAQAFHASDPLPPGGPNDPFDPPNDRHTAQRNIDLLIARIRSNFLVQCFAAGNTARFRTEEVTVVARRAPIETIRNLGKTLGLDRLPREMGEINEFGLQPQRCGEQIERVGDEKLELKLKPGQQVGLALTIRVKEDSESNTGALFLVEQFVRDKLVGGIGVLALGGTKDCEQYKQERSHENG